MTQPTAPAGHEPPSFTPVALRRRRDGWTPARQIAFIQALADTACVDEACRAVGLSVNAAYRLRRRPEAASFRQAWDVALDYAINRLADRALGRAMSGVATPIFYKGEQIGERRRYDEKLTMFLLRYRDPLRYGAWLDRMDFKRPHPDGAAMLLREAVRRVAEDGEALAAGRPRPERAPLKRVRLVDDPEEMAAEEEAREQEEKARRDAELERYLATLDAEAGDPASDRDVA